MKTDEFYPLNFDKLPSRWKVELLGEAILEIKNGFASGRHNIDGAGVPHLRPMNVDRKGQIVLQEVKYVSPRIDFELGPRDVLFNNTNSRELVGKTAPILQESNWNYSNHMTRLRVPTGFSNKFIAYQLHFLWMSGFFKQKCTQHINQASISSRTLVTIPLVVPPANEQWEIAHAVQQRMQMLEAVSKTLTLAVERLNRLTKMAIRQAAEGGLVPTEHALAQLEGREYQNAAQLLQEILSDSKSQMDIDLLRKEEVPTDEPGLPQGWVWARMEQVGDITLGRQRAPKYQKGKFMRPYLRVANVFEDRIDTTDVLRMNFEPEEFLKYRLEHGDILLNEGQSLEWVGRAAIFRDEIRDACFQNTLLRFRCRPGVSSGFALLVFRHYLHSKQFQQIARWSTNIAHLGRGRFASMRFPLPPLAEQERIVAEAQRILSIGESQTQILEELTSKLFFVRKKILEEALYGNLRPLEFSEADTLAMQSTVRDRLDLGDGRRSDDMAVANRDERKRFSLHEILRDHKSRMSPAQLFEESGIDIEQIDEFYEELKKEVLEGRIAEQRTGAEVSLVISR